ncbi:MAG: tyrosine-type recombinase/integrase [Nostoc sp.]|uniref:site-specific integrase n=1 Tax=Nostoc sp. TaxID=1180 RepID=UPI002FF464B3
MISSAKTPTGKAKKGQVTVREDSGSVKACFPRTHFANDKQVKLGTGIPLVAGWEATASKLQRRLQMELEEGKLATQEGTFNLDKYREILEEYGLRAKLRLVKSATSSNDQLPPKPELSVMEVWNMYCEYRKHGLRESHYESTYQGIFKNFLESAIEATKSEDALKIRNWLIENRNQKHVKELLSNLSKAYQRLMRNKLLTHNPYEGLTDEITNKGARGKLQNEVENDNDVLDKTKAYKWEEAQTILEFIKNNCLYWHDFTKFKFITGCRTGEAIAFMWCDIEWDKERVLIRRNYDRVTKKFYPLKNDKTYKGEETRRFPMPKDGELWNFLKSIPQDELGEVVFKSRNKKIIDRNIFGVTWRGRDRTNEGKGRVKGIIPTLIEQGKLTKYLSPYNTRHTFITHAVFDLGIDEKIVSNWCGHQIEVSNKHYQDVAIFAGRTNPEIHQQQSEIDQLKEQLKQRQKQMEEMKKLLESRER